MTDTINRWLAKAPPFTLKGNNQGTSERPTDLTVAQVNAMLGSASSGYYETFSGVSPSLKNRYLEHGGKPSNIVGVPMMFDTVLAGVAIKTANECSGWVRIKVDGVNLYSVQMSSQSIKIVKGISRNILEGESLSVAVESSNGMDFPTVRLLLL